MDDEELRLLSWFTKHPNVHIPLRWDRYSHFLEEGDFETFMPAITMSQNSKEYQFLLTIWKLMYLDLVMQKLDKNSYLHQRQFVRLMWIRQRFNKFLGPEWKNLNKHFGLWFDKISHHKEYDEPWKPIEELW